VNAVMKNFTLPCRAAHVRGQLKHSYLTNTICLKTLPEDLLESMLYLENGVPQHQSLRNQLNELSNLLGDPEQGFSPAQLVDQLTPFQQLPLEKRNEFKQRVHRQFATEFQLPDRKQRLEKLAAQFLAELDAFLSQSSTIAAMKKVQEAARILIRELESLPKGIWLWKTPVSKTMSS
jgi:hypothetical protein